MPMNFKQLYKYIFLNTFLNIQHDSYFKPKIQYMLNIYSLQSQNS